MASVLICAVENGYIVQGDDSDTPIVQRVHEGGDTTEKDVNALAHALWDVIERLEMIGTKHDAVRIRVVVEPGTDYRDDD